MKPILTWGSEIDILKKGKEEATELVVTKPCLPVSLGTNPVLLNSKCPQLQNFEMIKHRIIMKSFYQR